MADADQQEELLPVRKDTVSADRTSHTTDVNIVLCECDRTTFELQFDISDSDSESNSVKDMFL